jgi:phosphatidylglycerol---prolipoprotein diacylglyceryl transferase
MHYQLLAWLYWDPPRNLFVIPYIDHPVTIYGVCFTTGLILAYFLLIWIFSQSIARQDSIQERDVASWSLLVRYFQAAFDNPAHLAYPLSQQIDKKTRLKLLQLQYQQEPCKSLKSTLLNVMSNFLRQTSRSKIEEIFSPAIMSAKQWGCLLTDRLTWFVVLGIIIGARLGDVFFYDWPYYRNNLPAIFMVWKGGLASHGGVVGLLLAVYLYHRKVLKPFPEIHFINLLDMLSIPAGLGAFFIRLGNFFNQEVLGPPTDLPWGVIFGNPMDLSAAVPRHPAQMYEGIVYLGIFFFMLYLWMTRSTKLKPGVLSGLVLLAIFGSRFLIEFVKSPQSLLIEESFLQMGQYLSIPFIIGGLFLIFWKKDTLTFSKK